MNNEGAGLNLQFRPLNKAKELADMLKMEVTYAYDDLVFIGFSEIILQLPEDDSAFNLYVHEDVGESDRDGIIHSFQTKAAQMEIPLQFNGTYGIVEKAGSGEVDIVFN